MVLKSSFFLFVFMSFFAVGQKNPYYLGQRAEGGVIFYLFEEGDGVQHGLVLAPYHLAVDAVWGQKGINVENGESNWDGKSNSSAILKADTSARIAARLCDSFSHEGYDDWYLPALYEWSSLKQNLYLVDKTLSQIEGAEPMVIDLYWSSTESNEASAWYYNFQEDKPSNYYDKTSKILVRAIRRF